MPRRDKSIAANPRLIYIGAIGLLVIFAVLVADVRHQIAKNELGGVKTYYPAAVAMAHGQSPYAYSHAGGYPYVYPPLFAVMYEPLHRLPINSAARVSLVFDAAMLLLALLVSSRAMLARLGEKVNAANMPAISFGVALIALVPLHNELRGLETNSILLLSFALALYWLDRFPIGAGLALAVSINIKYLPIVAIPYLLLRRRWKATIATLAWTIALALLPAIQLGWSTNLAYLETAVGGLINLTQNGAVSGDSAQVHSADVETSLSIASATARIARHHGWPKSSELLGMAMIGGGWLGLILIPYRIFRRPILQWPDAAARQNPPFPRLVAIEWSALVIFALAFSPNTQNRNLVMAIIPATLAVHLLFFAGGFLPRIVAILASAILAVGLYLPIAMMGKPFTIAWVADGGACVCLLASQFLLTVATLASRGADVQNAGTRRP